jgi:hypothetical protein
MLLREWELSLLPRSKNQSQLLLRQFHQKSLLNQRAKPWLISVLNEALLVIPKTMPAFIAVVRPPEGEEPYDYCSDCAPDPHACERCRELRLTGEEEEDEPKLCFECMQEEENIERGREEDMDASIYAD